MNCLKEEIRKIFYNKTVIVFWLICTIFNIGLIIATSSKSGEWKKMSENYEYQSGQKIFQDIDGSELGLAYYDERYQKSNTLAAWMHEKYQKLESSLKILSEQQADLSTYAGELTPYVHKVLFEYLTKALMIEGILLFTFLVLETFFMEYYNKTADIVYSGFRGRRTVFDKMSAVLITGMSCLAVLCLFSYFIFFQVWDFEKIWDSNIASSYNYISDSDDPIFMKPFITWTSFTVKQYFCASLVLMIGIWLSWWLFSNMIVLVNKKISAAICTLAACLILPLFGLILFKQMPAFYFLNNWSITVNVYLNQMWFTDLGYYTLFPWQEILSVAFRLFFGMIGLYVGYNLFRRKDIC